MFRPVLLAAAACAALGFSANADEPQQPLRPLHDNEHVGPARHDPFVVSDDRCGASRFAHLLGQEYAQVYRASLIPSDSNRLDRIRPITLEYTPYRLNFVVGAEGRIIAIGCF